MTSERRDSHSTEFGLWLRQQGGIDSSLGYIASNIDYVWLNYRTGEWMMLEEKRHGSDVKQFQRDIFAKVDKACQCDSSYQGFHTLVFENTSPDDGQMWLDGDAINATELLEFLQFNGTWSNEEGK